MNPDIVAAVVAFLQGAMASSLSATPGSPQVWADYAPPGTIYPYAIVTEGPETYTAQGEDHATTGYWLSNLASGQIQVAFYATSKAQARALGRAAVRLLTDSQEQLQAADGRVMTIYPLQATSTVLGVEATTEATVFLRSVVFSYMQQFLE